MVAPGSEFHFFRFSKLVACVLHFIIIEVAMYATADVIFPSNGVVTSAMAMAVAAERNHIYDIIFFLCP